MEHRAFFVSRPRRIESLRSAVNGTWRLYQIVSSIRLKPIEYENFTTDLLADRLFLENVPGSGEIGAIVRCLKVSCPGRGSLLVLPDGTGHVALAALPEL